MKIYELTLKQYQNKKLKEYKKTVYWQKALKINKNIRDNIVKDKMETWKREWHDEVVEFGKNNELNNKIIYSFDKEFGRDYLIHCFRGNKKGLKGWINSDALTIK